MLTFSFNIFLFIIFIGIIIIGYTTRVISELKKLINLTIPLIVVYLWGRKIITWILNTKVFKYIDDKLSFIDIPYYNTIIILLLVLIIIYQCYMFTKIIIKIINKQFNFDIIKYKLGKFSNYLGVLFSIVRFYIIASILVIPFFILGFTTSKDFTTEFFTKNPLPFTEMGSTLIELDQVYEITSSLKTFQEVIDINYLKKENKIFYNLKNKLDEYEDYVKENGKYTPKAEIYPYLYAYINDNNTKNLEIKRYKGIIIWLNKENIDLNTIEYDLLINSYIINYDEIIGNTNDKHMKSLLEDSLNISKTYLIVNNWLKDTLGDKYYEEDLYNDENMEIIMKELVKERSNKKGLYDKLLPLNKNISNVKIFVKDYIEVYKPKMDKLGINMPFKYKLIATVLNDINFIPTFKNDPLFSIFIIDIIEKMEHDKYKIILDESVYHTLVKVIIPLYYINNEPLTPNEMKKITQSIEESLNKNVITEDFFLNLMFAFIDDNNNKNQSYLDDLLDSNLISVDEIKVLEAFFEKRFSNDKNKKVTEIKAALNKVGELNG